jgi:hypothetical protein
MFRYPILSLIVALCGSFSVQAQDTTSVYFKVGSHKLSGRSQQVLQQAFKTCDLADLKAITFIGYSDSTGKSESNRKLSERRAKTVSKFGEQFLPSGIYSEIQSRGEIPRIADSLSRRVDVIFYYRSADPEQSKDTLVIVPDDPRCFFIDGHIEACGHITIKQLKKKQVVYLQLLNEKELSDRKYYYVKNPSAYGAVAQRVNFKLETTGMLWWREKRLTATIPKDSYDKYGLFYLENPPCEGCKEQLFKMDTNMFFGTRILSNYFTMSVTQLKTKLFRPNILRIRVPKEYMDKNTTYYAVKQFRTGKSGSNRERLKWEEKRGKRREQYVFATIQIKNVASLTIATPQRTSYCPEKGTWKGHDGWFRCRGINGGIPGEFYLGAGVHAFYHNDTATALVAASLEYRLNRHQLALNVGLNHRLGLCYAAYYHYELYSFYTMRNRLLDPWQSLKETRFSSRVGIYAGPEFRSSYTKNYRSFSEVNLHAGFSMDWENGLGYYLQGGIARDLSNRMNTGFYPYVQAGLRFRFAL